ncbi:ABC transporter substrate-binding protein [Haloferacaceae archaeon DSL9]
MRRHDQRATRRRVLTAGGGLAAFGLAGCLEESTDDDAPADGGDTESTSDAESDSTAGEDGAYTVSMEPMGEVTFESVPERWVAYKSGYGDMGVALGVADGLVGIDDPDGSLALLEERFYSQLPGFDLDTDGIADIRTDGDSIDKEIFYEMDADLHLMDPNLPLVYFDWDEADVEEVESAVAPFFGNFARRERDDSWGEPYASYTLLEAFEKVAEVFREIERYEAFVDLHDDVQTRIDDALPSAEERPTIGLLNGGSNPAAGEFYAIDPTGAGYEMKQYRDLGIQNAFEGVETGEYGLIDYETLLDVDPEIIVFHWGVTYEAEEFDAQFVDPLAEHSVGRELTAVQNGAVYPGGTAEQGPIISLFQLEMLAQQQYPDAFGEFPGLGSEPDETLFDRERVAAIITGDN